MCRFVSSAPQRANACRSLLNRQSRITAISGTARRRFGDRANPCASTAFRLAKGPAGWPCSPRGPPLGPMCGNLRQSVRPPPEHNPYRKPIFPCAPHGTRLPPPLFRRAVYRDLPLGGVLTTQPEPRLFMLKARMTPIKLMLLRQPLQAPGRLATAPS